MHSPEQNMIAAALDTLAAEVRATDGARERMVMALGASRLALACEQDVLCLDRDSAPESYSFEEAREAADRRRRPRQDLLAAGLEKPAKKPGKKK